MSLLVCLFLTLVTFGNSYWKPTVYQKIKQTPKLGRFFSLLEINRPAKLNLQYGELTVFAPTNEAFEWYSGGNLKELINYHMVWYAKELNQIKRGPLATVMEENPPVWITKLDDDLYINNARIISEASDFVSEINTSPKKKQVLHIIDEVLDPGVKRTILGVYNPTAHDFLWRNAFWNSGDHKIDLFRRKAKILKKEALFKAEGAYTFFIPIDEGFTDYRQQMLDGNVIAGHIIPNRVLFTRPTAKDMPFETLANGDYLSIVILISGTEGKLYAKSHTLIGDSLRPTGEIIAEIVRANIPVKNGVVHLIKRPLIIFDRNLTLFPYLPLMSKLSGDPFLNYTYHLGEVSNFNLFLNDGGNKYTYFVPRDKAWRNLHNFLDVDKKFLDQFILTYGKSILSRQLVIANSSYTMEDLKKKSNSSDTADINLPTLGGFLRIGVGEVDGTYVIYWRNKFIPVYRANYMCTNGIIHIVDDLFVNEEDLEVNESKESSESNPLKILNTLIFLTL